MVVGRARWPTDLSACTERAHVLRLRPADRRLRLSAARGHASRTHGGGTEFPRPASVESGCPALVDPLRVDDIADALCAWPPPTRGYGTSCWPRARSERGRSRGRRGAGPCDLWDSLGDRCIPAGAVPRRAAVPPNPVGAGGTRFILPRRWNDGRTWGSSGCAVMTPPGGVRSPGRASICRSRSGGRSAVRAVAPRHGRSDWSWSSCGCRVSWPMLRRRASITDPTTPCPNGPGALAVTIHDSLLRPSGVARAQQGAVFFRRAIRRAARRAAARPGESNSRRPVVAGPCDGGPRCGDPLRARPRGVSAPRAVAGADEEV